MKTRARELWQSFSFYSNNGKINCCGCARMLLWRLGFEGVYMTKYSVSVYLGSCCSYGSRPTPDFCPYCEIWCYKTKYVYINALLRLTCLLVGRLNLNEGILARKSYHTISPAQWEKFLCYLQTCGKNEDNSLNIAVFIKNVPISRSVLNF